MRKLTLILLALILIGCAQQKVEVKLNATNITPDKIMGLNKFVCLTGEDALRFVKMMHVGEIRFVKDIAMMHYLNVTDPYSRYVTVWVTVYPNSSVAREEADRMAKSMVKFGWKDVRIKNIDGLSVYYVKPPGRNVTHYFWCNDGYVIYMIPHNMTKNEIYEFIMKITK